MLTLSNISAGYAGTPVLHDISLRVARGEMLGLLGPNGSGKSTLLLALSGVLPLQQGTIHIGEQNLALLAPKKRAQLLASVPQFPASLAELDAFSTVLMGRYPYLAPFRSYAADDHRLSQAALAATMATPLAKRNMATLSGGETQRIFIARSLAQQAGTLLLDEPTTALDIAHKIAVFDRIRQYNIAFGLRIITAIHDLNLAVLYCKRLVFLKQGRIVCDGPAREVFTADILEMVYETRVALVPHPLTGTPQACFIPGADGA